MNNYFPSVRFTRLQNNQRTHKHVRKKTIKNSKYKTYADGKPDEYFLLMSGEESDDEIYLNDLSHLRNRQKQSISNNSLQNAKIRQHSFSDPFLNCDFITLELQENDTLQRISVKYGCSISDIKRANNIISNQEFYGLRHVKVPVQKYSLLSEMLPSGTCDPSHEEEKIETNDFKAKTVNVGIGPMLSTNSADDAATFLKRMDEDLMKIMLNTPTEKGSLEEVTAALNESRFHPLVKDAYGSVDGVQWSYLLIFILLVAIIIPLFIILYMYYIKPPNQSHHEFYQGNLGNLTVLPFNSISSTKSYSKS